MKRALKEYRVLLLDQRGTGLSTPVSTENLLKISENPEAQADYLSHFRQDSIVRDAEAFRVALNQDKITLLGQSFGGFCILTYLSFFPDSIEKALFTVGLAPVGTHIDDVYRATYKRVQERNRRYYKRYPQDIARVKQIIAYLSMRSNQGSSVEMPTGGKLTPRRFLQLGLALGSLTGMEALHYLLEGAFNPDGTLTYGFLRGVESFQSFDTNPIYYLLHEPIYVDAGSTSYEDAIVIAATTNEAEDLLSSRDLGKPGNWSAERILAEIIQNDPESEFNYEQRILDLDDSKPVYFTGEMVYPWMSEDYPTLSLVKDLADLLAKKADWGPIYDTETLKNIAVPCAALVSYEDIYVERQFSEKTAALLGDNCKIWITNEYQHSGLRDDGYNVLDKLLAMAANEEILPS
mmetsp:Transcript_20092/g.28291  ORF Transcript_20092/g.28291 Transcript_20092/m.28291 type:complete len:406 (+) Transcript_20092:2-1219(+)